MSEDGESASEVGGYLDVDLDRRTWTSSSLGEDEFGRFIGGRGYNVWRLHRDLPAPTDPLGPDNIFLISRGLLTGTVSPVAARVHINALSPLTGMLGSSNLGGRFGLRLRSCGIRSLIVRGRASGPVYLHVDGGSVAIRDASRLWGLDAFETQTAIREELDDDAPAVLTIGPAGENRVPFACVVSGRDHVAGRTGMGAVMGSKNLKAVVVGRGGVKTPGPAPSEMEAVRRYVREIRRAPEFSFFQQYGGAGYVTWADDLGIVASRNYRENRFERIQDLDGRKLAKNVVRSHGCPGCPVGCKAELRLKNGQNKDQPANRPEFESMLNLGPKCGLSDLETVVRLDNLCTRLGLDTTTTGTAIGFAMDLYDRGILTLEKTGGLDLSWGNGEAMERLVFQTARKEGLGAVLSLGVKEAAEVIGGGARDFAPHVKGLELAAYHPSTVLGTALSYAVSSRGGDYSNVYASMEYRWSQEEAAREFQHPEAVDIHAAPGKGRLIKRAVLVTNALDCLGLCKVPALSLMCRFDLENEAALASALTGRTITAAELMRAGERTANLERLFNFKHAPAAEPDGLPDMFFKNGRWPLTRANMESMLQGFYQAMGWDRQGRPTREKLEELGLEPPD